MIFPCIFGLGPASLSDLLGELFALDGGVLNGDTRSSEDVVGAANAIPAKSGLVLFGGIMGLLPIFGFDVLAGIGGAPLLCSSCTICSAGLSGARLTGTLLTGKLGLRPKLGVGGGSSKHDTGAGAGGAGGGGGRTMPAAALTEADTGGGGGGGARFSVPGDGVFPRLGTLLLPWGLPGALGPFNGVLRTAGAGVGRSGDLSRASMFSGGGGGHDGGDLGDSTRNVGGDIGGANVLYIDSGRWRRPPPPSRPGTVAERYSR